MVMYWFVSELDNNVTTGWPVARGSAPLGDDQIKFKTRTTERVRIPAEERHSLKPSS